MRGKNYKGGSVIVSIRIWKSTRAIQVAQMKPMGTLVNDSLDKLVHWLQMGYALQSQGLKLIRSKDIKESYEEGRSTYTKIRIRRQNYDYMKQNMLTISQCVNYAVKWFGV